MKDVRVAANISEGRRTETIEAVKAAILSVEGVRMESTTPDSDHNRTVYIFRGEPEAVLEGAKCMADVALELIDMRNHHGSHPRMGAIDVVPFIPLSDVSVDEAVALSKRFGKYLGSLGVPVYYYEYAATCPERKNLVDIRKGEYELLKEKICSGCFVPDEGPNMFNPKSGATVTGCRFPLVALNVNLNTTDIQIAKKIVQQLREAKGGYKNVRAIALEILDKNMVQVSINLVQYEQTPVHKVFETLKSEAMAYGVTVSEVEIVGGIPLKAIEDVVRFYLQAHNFNICEDCY